MDSSEELLLIMQQTALKKQSILWNNWFRSVYNRILICIIFCEWPHCYQLYYTLTQLFLFLNVLIFWLKQFIPKYLIILFLKKIFVRSQGINKTKQFSKIAIRILKILMLCFFRMDFSVSNKKLPVSFLLLQFNNLWHW